MTFLDHAAPVDFALFAAMLAGIAFFHRHALAIALVGLSAITAKKVLWTGFAEGPGLLGLAAHVQHEWVVLANLFLLLNGFSLLARHFEESRVPDWMPAALPDDWKGGFVLLVFIFILSAFLDNIAAALIGATVAHHVFKGRVRVGYLAAVVAASNAGGAGSVLGDTTTTMLWIGGVDPFVVLRAYVAAGAALVVFGVPAAIAQQRHAPVVKHASAGLRISFRRLAVVAVILAAAAGANIVTNLFAPEIPSALPVIGLAVAAAVLLTAFVARPDWSILPQSARGALFLVALVAAASMMPVDALPRPSWVTTLGLGFVSAVFDNIPLTALALKQGGYDWGLLAYAVGFGGSMIWFGSSAGVAVAGLFPDAKSTGRWLTQGWPIALAYVVGFALMLATLGWTPDKP